jgi:hypothetical protein
MKTNSRTNMSRRGLEVRFRLMLVRHHVSYTFERFGNPEQDDIRLR